MDSDILIFKLLDDQAQIVYVAAQTGDAFDIDVVAGSGLQPELVQLRSIGLATGELVAVIPIYLDALKCFLLAP